MVKIVIVSLLLVVALISTAVVSDAKSVQKQIVLGYYPQAEWPDRLASILQFVNQTPGYVGMLQIQSKNIYDPTVANALHKHGLGLMATVDGPDYLLGYASEQDLVDDVLRCAANGADYIMLNEWQDQGVPFTATQFNQLKAQVKAINPNIKLGIVESRLVAFNQWKGAMPDFVSDEQYQNPSATQAQWDTYFSKNYPNKPIYVYINSVSTTNAMYSDPKVTGIIYFDVGNTGPTLSSVEVTLTKILGRSR